MKSKLDSEKIIEAYNSGESMNGVAKRFGTYPTTIKRILEKNGIESRHDYSKKGILTVKEGDRLIEWAKSQGRPVTKAELAKIAGTKRLSPSYFIKYPELGRYVKTNQQNEIKDYSQQLYNWLKNNNILYKPNDKKTLGVSVTALLLEDYSNIVLQINIKPRCISKQQYECIMEKKYNQASKKGLSIIWLQEKDFKNLDKLKNILNDMKIKNVK